MSCVSPQTNPESITVPLSSEYGTYNTVKARFWPWLEPFSVQNVWKTIYVVPSPLAIGWTAAPVRVLDAERKGKNLEMFQGLSSESQGQNLTLIVLHVLSFLDSGEVRRYHVSRLIHI